MAFGRLSIGILACVVLQLFLALVGASPVAVSIGPPSGGSRIFSPEAICQLDAFKVTHDNLVKSGAIDFYSTWSRNRSDDPNRSEPEEFAMEMLHDDHLSCRLTDNGCKRVLSCPEIIRWMAPDGRVDNIEDIRRVYFVYTALDLVFQSWRQSIDSTRKVAFTIGGTGMEFAFRFFPQFSEKARRKCDAAKYRKKTAIIMSIDFVTIFVGAMSGGLVGASLGPMAAPLVSEVMKGLAGGVTNAGMAMLREPLNNAVGRHMDTSDSSCHYPMFKDVTVKDDDQFTRLVSKIMQGFEDQIVNVFTNASLGVNKVPGNSSQLALYLESQRDTLFTEQDPLAENLDLSKKFQENMIRLLIGPLVSNTWRTQSCYLHCTPVARPGDCLLHDKSPLDGLEFCSGNDFCQAGCWVSGKHRHRLYPLWGWLKQTDNGAKDSVWTDEGGQAFARAEEELKQWPWNLDIRKGLKVSHELSDSPTPALDMNTVMEKRVTEMDLPLLRLPTCRNTWLNTLPDYTRMDGDKYKSHGKWLFPCACGDDFGSGTLQFYETTFAGVSDLQCYEKLGANKDPIADMCRGQLHSHRRTDKSITAEYLANCNHVVARMTVRKAGHPRLTVCDARTQWAQKLQKDGVSDKDMDAQFCKLDFGKESSDAPWGHYESLAYENKLVLRSLRDPIVRVMQRCEAEYGMRKQSDHWAHNMHFMDDDDVCHW